MAQCRGVILHATKKFCSATNLGELWEEVTNLTTCSYCWAGYGQAKAPTQLSSHRESFPSKSSSPRLEAQAASSVSLRRLLARLHQSADPSQDRPPSFPLRTRDWQKTLESAAIAQRDIRSPQSTHVLPRPILFRPDRFSPREAPRDSRQQRGDIGVQAVPAARRRHRRRPGRRQSRSDGSRRGAPSPRRVQGRGRYSPRKPVRDRPCAKRRGALRHDVEDVLSQER